EIEFGLGPAVIPVGVSFELAPPEPPLRECVASDGNAHARRLPGDAALLRDRSGGRDNATRDKALPALVLARKQKECVALDDALATIHRLLRNERERPRLRLIYLSFDRERHVPPRISI